MDEVDGRQVERRHQDVVAARPGDQEVHQHVDGPWIGILHLDVHQRAPADVEHLGQRRHVGEGLGDLGPGQVAEDPGGRVGVVADHQLAVGRAVDVELHAVGTQLDRPRHRRKGVLGRLPVGAAMGEHEHALTMPRRR